MKKIALLKSSDNSRGFRYNIELSSVKMLEVTKILMKLFDESGITQVIIENRTALQVDLQKFKDQEESKSSEKSDINNEQKETSFVKRYGHSHRTIGASGES